MQGTERGKKIRQTQGEVGRQHQGMERPGVQQVPEVSGEQGKMEHMWCPNDPCGLGIDYDDDEADLHSKGGIKKNVQ